MALLLGIDTGGTYTDAVLYDEDRTPDAVVSKAKALTTRDDLAIGIDGAIGAVLTESGIDPTTIALCSISTTLATNALVEGVRRRICLIFVGFDEADLHRSGLAETLGTDPVIQIAGGFKATGEVRAPLDLDALAPQVDAVKDGVEAFAVVTIFGGRNPAHEIAIRDLIRSRCALPVTCGHDLSGELDGPRNALTCVLNARLIGTISALIASTEGALAARDIDVPLMIVRGDGSLVSAEFARERPIETILSGPAASLVGAAHLSGSQDAVISDIGGTTTDIAILRDGRPMLSETGATVGGHRTMIAAVAMTTHGLGGDSDVGVDERAFNAALTLGPRKLVPVSLFALDEPDLVKKTLATQGRNPRASDTDARFAIPTRIARPEGLRRIDHAVLDRIGSSPIAIDSLALARLEGSALASLVSLGLIRIAGFTPSDAAHVLGLHEAWNTQTACDAAALFARRKDRKGNPIATDGRSLSQMVVDTLIHRSAQVLLDTALDHDGIGSLPAPLLEAALARKDGAARIDIGLALPLIGLGASASTYYPSIGKALGTTCLVPDHADVANAVGAVAGRVTLERAVRFTSPTEGRYRAHLPGISEDFGDLAAAKERTRAILDTVLRKEAEVAGAGDVEIVFDYTESAPVIEGRPLFIEAVLTGRASGRPSLRKTD